VQQKKLLSIHEYQAMDLLNQNGIRVPKYTMATTSEEVLSIARNLGIAIMTIVSFASLLNEDLR
jgi:succinyl-CoA synthetase beta subunit